MIWMVSNAGTAGLSLLLNREPTNAQLIGNYKLDVPWGFSMLQINEDGTFSQEIQEKNQPMREIKGKWSASSGENFRNVDFRPFGQVWDDNHKGEFSYSTISFYKPRWGSVYGSVDDDLGQRYERQFGATNVK